VVWDLVGQTPLLVGDSPGGPPRGVAPSAYLRALDERVNRVRFIGRCVH